jgi:hypothetical protein
MQFEFTCVPAGRLDKKNNTNMSHCQVIIPVQFDLYIGMKDDPPGSGIPKSTVN